MESISYSFDIHIASKFSLPDFLDRRTKIMPINTKPRLHQQYIHVWWREKEIGRIQEYASIHRSIKKFPLILSPGDDKKKTCQNRIDCESHCITLIALWSQTKVKLHAAVIARLENDRIIHYVLLSAGEVSARTDSIGGTASVVLPTPETRSAIGSRHIGQVSRCRAQVIQKPLKENNHR